MSKETRKPTHQLIRYYDSGRNAPRAQVGALWSNDDGSFSIRIDGLEQQIWLNAFQIEEKSEQPET